jgi:hypothetical protein
MFTNDAPVEPLGQPDGQPAISGNTKNGNTLTDYQQSVKVDDRSFSQLSKSAGVKRYFPEACYCRPNG